MRELFSRRCPVTLDVFHEMLERSDDALVVATRAGNTKAVGILIAHDATARLAQARLAHIKLKSSAQLESSAQIDELQSFAKIDELLNGNLHVSEAQPSPQKASTAPKSPTTPKTLKAEIIRVRELCEKELSVLTFEREFSGQLVPPRPSPQQISNQVSLAAPWQC